MRSRSLASAGESSGRVEVSAATLLRLSAAFDVSEGLGFLATSPCWVTNDYSGGMPCANVDVTVAHVSPAAADEGRQCPGHARRTCRRANALPSCSRTRPSIAAVLGTASGSRR